MGDFYDGGEADGGFFVFASEGFVGFYGDEAADAFAAAGEDVEEGVDGCGVGCSVIFGDFGAPDIYDFFYVLVDFFYLGLPGFHELDFNIKLG